MDVINLQEKLNLFHDQWHPRIVGELNDSYVKLVKLQGEFIWHQHAHEDELFLVLSGHLTIHLRDRDLHIGPGEFAVIPRAVEHCPFAVEEVHVLLLEPKTTLNTGDQGSSERTISAEWI